MRRLLLCAAAVALGGCVDLQPRYERPSPPVAAQFPFAGNGPGQPANEIGWQQFFTDPRLRTLVERALANNRDLRVAMLNIEAARAQVGARRADEWPTVNAALGATRQPGANGQISSI